MLKSLLLVFCFVQYAQAKKAYWEYGLGAGVVQFEKYPGADEYQTLALPVPTFQYHGDILHADDRDGVQAQFFNSEKWEIDFSGLAFPPLDSKNSKARKGMKDLALIAAFGPQLIYKVSPAVEYTISLFEGVSLDLNRQAVTGPIYQSRLVFAFENQFWNFQQEKTLTRIFLTSRWAERDFQKVFYDVSSAFKSKSGWFSHEVGVLWQMGWKKTSSYVGWAFTDYSAAANKKSPLHQADQAFTFFLGLNYVLGQSDTEE